MLRDASLVPLSRQHHNGLALCVLTDRSLARDASPENLGRLCRRAVERYDLELVNHFQLEQQILFPAVARELGASELVDQLLAEHRRLERLAEALRARPQRGTLEEFLRLLRDHIRTEENVLFEDIQRRLPRDTLDALGTQLEAKVVRVCLQE